MCAHAKGANILGDAWASQPVIWGHGCHWLTPWNTLLPCVTIPNLVALGQTVGASVRVPKWRTLGHTPLERGVWPLENAPPHVLPYKILSLICQTIWASVGVSEISETLGSRPISHVRVKKIDYTEPWKMNRRFQWAKVVWVSNGREKCRLNIRVLKEEK